MINILVINRKSAELAIRCAKEARSRESFSIHLLTHSDTYTQCVESGCFDSVTVCRLSGDEEWLAAGRWLAARFRVDRVVATNERFLLTAGSLRDELGIPGISFSVAEKFRDKVLMKEVIRNAGLPVPLFAELSDYNSVHNLLQQCKKVVLKRRNYTGGMDVRVLDVESSLAGELSRISLQFPGVYEVEEFISGRMFHCDSIVNNSRVVFDAVSEYLTKPGDFHNSVLGGSLSLPDDSPISQKVRDYSRAAISALGLGDGVTHLEVFVTPNGEVTLCEIAARPGGGGIVDLIKASHSVDLETTAFDLECGLDVGHSTEISQQVPSAILGVFWGHSNSVIRESLVGSGWYQIPISSREVTSDVAQHCTDYDSLWIISGSSAQDLELKVRRQVRIIRDLASL